MKFSLCLILAVGLAIPLSVASQEQAEEYFELFNLCERDDGKWYTMVDEEGAVLMRTARVVHAGDQWIGQDNRAWVVYKVEEDTAYARPDAKGSPMGFFAWLQQVLTSFGGGQRPVQQEQDVKQRIAVYHTHGAEAYVPSDGTESDPQGGGIMNVAKSLADSLEEQGVEAALSQETHVPHDSGAYRRSRNTKEELIKDGVDAVVDVHRDAVPAEEYLDEVDGEEMVQIQLVVGSQNQNHAAIQQFAEELKQVADEKYPGLIKGIFTGTGNYNQDMTPRSILIEVGSHENSAEGAQQSVVLFADVLTTYLYGTAAGQDMAQGSPGSRVFRTLLWIVAILAVGGGLFLYISSGSWPEMKRKLQGFARGEFGDLFKLRLGNRQDDNNE